MGRPAPAGSLTPAGALCFHTPPDSVYKACAQPSVPMTDLNMTHLDLFYRFINNTPLVFGVGYEHPDEGHRFFLKYALRARYLMSLALAMMSLRQAIDEPLRHAEFYQLAMTLLNAGLRELHEATEHICESNIGSIFLSSSVVGTYMLCDTFVVKHDETPSGFLDRVINTISVSRGARAVLDNGHWLLLARSELRPILGFDVDGLEPPQRDRVDEHSRFHTLFELTKASNMNDDEKAACDIAIHQLLRDYGANTGIPHLRRAARFLRGRAWPVNTTPLYMELLTRRVPEALIVLAHWAVLLHQISDVWAIGDAGILLLNAVSSALGPGWGEWLAWPKEVISRPRHVSAVSTPA